jgi:hypothetical protein
MRDGARKDDGGTSLRARSDYLRSVGHGSALLLATGEAPALVADAVHHVSGLVADVIALGIGDLLAGAVALLAGDHQLLGDDGALGASGIALLCHVPMMASPVSDVNRIFRNFLRGVEIAAVLARVVEPRAVAGGAVVVRIAHGYHLSILSSCAAFIFAFRIRCSLAWLDGVAVNDSHLAQV